MGAYLVWFPNAPVRTLIFLIFPIFTTISAKWLLGVWFLTQFFTSPNSGVAWAAHVGGFVFGVAVWLAVGPTQAVQRMAWRPAYQGQMQAHPWDSTGGCRPEERPLGKEVVRKCRF